MRSVETATEPFDTHAFPATSADLIDAYGEQVIELPNGPERLGEVLERVGPAVYVSADDARLAALSAVSNKAIGRKGYSDRDPTAMGVEGREQVSF